MTLTDLLELRKKATQGEWCVSDFAIHGEPKAEENATFIAALKNFFDLPSTQAMLEAREGKLNAAPQAGQSFGGIVETSTPEDTAAPSHEGHAAGPAAAAPDYEELCGRLDKLWKQVEGLDTRSVSASWFAAMQQWTTEAATAIRRRGMRRGIGGLYLRTPTPR